MYLPTQDFLRVGSALLNHNHNLKPKNKFYPIIKSSHEAWLNIPVAMASDIISEVHSLLQIEGKLETFSRLRNIRILKF